MLNLVLNLKQIPGNWPDFKIEKRRQWHCRRFLRIHAHVRERSETRS
jgi:hypothetical protein